jgi:hypothetical protein
MLHVLLAGDQLNASTEKGSWRAQPAQVPAFYHFRVELIVRLRFSFALDAQVATSSSMGM